VIWANYNIQHLSHILHTLSGMLVSDEDKSSYGAVLVVADYYGRPM